jgi:DNA-directed RNA polymerase specialized sigma24 family protein
MRDCLHRQAARIVRCGAALMLDAKCESSKRVLEYLAKPRARWNLVRIALWTTRVWASAEDLVTDSLMRVLDPDDRPWDGRRPFLSFMSFLLREVYKDQMRRYAAREIPEDGRAIDEATQSALPSAEEAIDRTRSLNDHLELYARLCKDLESEDPSLRKCLELQVEEVSSEEQAAILGWSIDKVYQAHRTIARHALRIRDAWIAERETALRLRRQGKPIVEEAKP